MSCTKINEKGEYQYFPGVTVISKLKDASKFKHVEDFIKSSKLSKYYSALPIESYHMTLFELLSCRSHDYVRRYREQTYNFNLIQTFLHYNHVSVKPEFGKLYCGGTLGIKLKLCYEDVKKVLKFRQDCNILTGIDNSPFYIFHMTLAYNYKPMTEDLYTELKVLENIIKTVLTKNMVERDELVDKTLTPFQKQMRRFREEPKDKVAYFEFEKATVSMFKDMTDFQVWNSEEFKDF